MFGWGSFFLVPLKEKKNYIESRASDTFKTIYSFNNQKKYKSDIYRVRDNIHKSDK